MDALLDFLEDCMAEGVVTCEKCGNTLELDAEECYCGWKNPMRLII